MYLDGSIWDVRENGSWKKSTTVTANATAKIKRDGNVIKYYINDVLNYTSLTTESGNLYVHATFNGAGSATVTLNLATVVNQLLEVEFYPTGNVQNVGGVVNQLLEVEFYPEGNVANVGEGSSGFKFWYGMKGKKRYGKGLSRKVSF